MSILAELLRASTAQLEGRDVSPDHITLDEARATLVRIAQAAEVGRIESAQFDEHRLYVRCLKAIAAGARDSQRLASVAILATEVRFSRGLEEEV